jgi:hypothetical protein
MNKRIYVCFLLLFASSFAHSQDANLFRLSNEDLVGMQEKRWSVYTEDQLWGYINGGADIYLEYGFDFVSAQDITWQNESFKVDAYKMKSPMAAYGIYSISRFGCIETGVISNWDCIGKQQVQAAIGNLYLSVISYSGSDKGNEIAKEIGRTIIGRYQQSSFSLPSIITESCINPSLPKIKLITGQLGMQNAYSSLESAFGSISDYQLWVVPFEIDSASQTLLLVNFSSNTDLQSVKEKLLEKNTSTTKSIIKEKGSQLMIINSKDNDVNAEKLERLFSLFESWNN